MYTLKDLRMTYNLTQKELADYFGLNHKTILNAEKDSSNIKDSLIKKYITAFNVKYDDIVLGTEYEISAFYRNKKTKFIERIKQLNQ